MTSKPAGWVHFLTAFAAVMFVGLSFGAAVPPVV
jgi:hypothetical protein